MRETSRPGDRLAVALPASAGTSKMYPCGFWSDTLEAPVKSGPTSGPFTVSSQVIQEPHGMTPPLQLYIVPFRLV